MHINHVYIKWTSLLNGGKQTKYTFILYNNKFKSIMFIPKTINEKLI